MRPEPYRFTPEQLGRLEAHFGGREVWLPMPLDDLVAALAEAHRASTNVASTGDRESALSDRVLRVANTGDKEKEEGMSTITASTRKPATTDRSALSTQLITEVKKAFPGVELTQKKAYIRAHLGEGRGTTLGYLYPSNNGGKSAVETIKADGSGKYDYTAISNAAELKKAIAAMRAVQKRATAAAASKNKAS